MQIQDNNMPDFIFDWVERYAFDELNRQQQEAVLQLVDVATYTTLRQGALVMLQMADESKDERQVVVNKIKGNGMSWFWKAASVLLFASSAWLWYAYQNNPGLSQTQTITRHDTIYLQAQKPIAPPTITSSNKQQLTQHKGVQKIRIRKKLLKSAITSESPSAVPLNSIPTLSPESMNDLPNQPKRNSKKFDLNLASLPIVRAE